MSWVFDESQADYVTMADDAALTLPNAVWTIAGWIKGDGSNAGSGYRYFLGWYTIGDINSLSLGVAETSVATYGDRVSLRFRDASGESNLAYSQAAISNSAWVHVAMIRQADGYVRCFLNGSESTEFEDQSADTINAGVAFYFGRKQGDSASYIGKLAEWAKWDADLSADTSLASLVAGASPTTVGTPSWYCPMYNTFTESVLGLTITNSGAAIDADDHPVVYATNTVKIFFVTTSPGKVGVLSTN